MNAEVVTDLYQEEIYHLRQKTIVVISVPWNQLNDGSIQLLAKILASVKLDLSSVRIISLPRLDDVSGLPEYPSHIISFGVPTSPPIELYQPSKLMGVPIITADELDLLDDSRKKNLWAGLKAMFAV